MSSDIAKAGEGARWVALMNFFAVSLKFLTIPILARFIGPAEFAVVAVAIAVFQLLSMISIHSLNTALIAAKDEREELWHTAFYITIGLGLTVSLLLFLFAPLLASLMGVPRAETFIYAIGCIGPIVFLAEFFVALMSKRLEFRRMVGTNMLANISSASAAITLAFMGFGIWALMAQHIMLAIVRSIGLFAVSRFRPRWHFDWRLIRPVAPHAGRSLLAMLGHYFSNQSVVLIITRVLGASLGGIFFVCNRFSVLPIEIVGASLGRVIFPNFSKLSRESQDRSDFLLWSLSMSSAVLSPIYLGMWAVAEPLTDVLLGPGWAGSSSVLAIMALVGVLMGPMGVFSSYFQGVNRFDLLVRVNFLCAFLLVGFVVGGGYYWGLVGACIGIFAAKAIAVLVTGIVAFRIEKTGSVKGFLSFLPTIIAASVMAAVVVAILSYPLLAGTHAVAQLAVAGGLGCLLYVAILKYTLPKTFTQVLQLLLPRFGKSKSGAKPSPAEEASV